MGQAAIRVGLLLAVLASWAIGAETDPGRAPTGAVTDPKELLKEPDGLEFRFGYLPTLGRLRLVVLHAPETYTRWEVTLSLPGRSEVLARSDGALPMPQAGATVEVPALDAGTYELRFALIAADGARRELRRTLERKHFPWEACSLGRDRVVIPPFTPLETAENPPRVSAVLRRHTLDGTGLWTQVASQGRDLLAEPMRLEIASEAGRHVAAGERFDFEETSADRVRGSGAWSAGPIAGRSTLEFDYDGMMKLTLEFGAPGQRIDAMELIIPLRSEETWLMHPVTDLLRFHYAGRIPDGKGWIWEHGGQRREVLYTETGKPDPDGRVWDSGHVGRWQLPGPFVPYIWLGGPERGIAWFAENDRDWSLAADRPCLEIRRQGDVTSLVVRLVTEPVTLTRPRRITFGLMATPAKPMPETPVSYRRWWTGSPGGKPRDSVALDFMGACYYWGAAGPCYAFSPAFGNFRIYEELARLRRGGAKEPAFVDRWLAQFTGEEFAPLLDTYRAHINWSVHHFSSENWQSLGATGQTAYMCPYTNGRSVPWGDEARTMADEWSTIDVADPRWPGEERFVRAREGGFLLAAYGKVAAPGQASGIAYGTDPVSSWQDMVLFYHKRMLETFADGIYFDDYFLVPNYSPLGPGYVDDEGRLHPGVNLFGFHDLTKRVAVMQHQMGRRPMIFIHMTNAHIVPMLSFGTHLLDHEWRDQGDFRGRDFQERLYLDDDTSLLLTQSTGLQSGCLGIAHDLLYHDPRLQRTALGVALTHEMRLSASGTALQDTIGTHLCDFGYGLPDCRVWRYWDSEQPLHTAGAPVKSLVLACGSRAMLVVASYGDGGEVELNLDRRMLGLPDDALAVDVETGEQLASLGPGRFKLTMARHDFRVVRVDDTQAVGRQARRSHPK